MSSFYLLFLYILFIIRSVSSCTHVPQSSLCASVRSEPEHARVGVVTLRLFLDSWYFPIASFASRLLEFPAVILIYIVINSPLLCSS